MTLTDYIAIYGAVLSTVLAVMKYLEQRPKIKVSLDKKSEYEKDSSTLKSTLVVICRNDGLKVAEINTVGFILPNKKRVPIRYPDEGDALPHKLNPESICAFHIRTRPIADTLIQEGYSEIPKIRAYALDANERIYKSKVIEIDLKDWKEFFEASK